MRLVPQPVSHSTWSCKRETCIGAIFTTMPRRQKGSTMRVSQLFGETRRDVNAETEFKSHEYLLRAGYIRQLGSGIFANLPLAHRVLRKIEQVLREEMDRIGGQEVTMPVVHPAEIWQASGRWETVGPEMVRFKDRADRDMVLAMTHEEVVGWLASSEVKSYKQLPMCVYQMQTKFRDEPRARGGLIRVREFVMKDAYSLDTTEEGLHAQYVAQYNAYFRIMARVGLPALAVGSDVGMMGGSQAHEFMYLTPAGEDQLLICEGCGYAANREVAHFVKEAPETADALALEEVETPGVTTIVDLAAFLNITPSQTAKAVFYMGDYGPKEGEKLVFAVVRGDMDANQAAIRNAAGAHHLRPAEGADITAVGCVPGYASPIGIDRKKVVLVVDDLVAASANLVAGANKANWHVRNTNCGRDYEPDVTAHIAAAYEGAGCPECGKPMVERRGVEVGNIFKLGTKYTVAFNANFLDENGKSKPIIMGSYGIGVGRLLACVAEEYCDDKGLNFPISIAPYAVNIVAIGKQPETMQKAEALYDQLRNAGVEVLYDDRKAGAGAKFTDAELRGIPIRVTCSDRSLENGNIEITPRATGEGQEVKYEEGFDAVQQAIKDAWTLIEDSLANVKAWN